MTDRELLELAAKACGYDTSHRWNAERLLLDPPVIDLCIPNVSTGWNPLIDDGDALRLAVKLGIKEREPVRICIEYQHDGEQAFTCIEHRGETTQYHTDDPYAATRRAIVRAAAEIGKAMK